MDIEELGKKLGITDEENSNKASDEELEDLISLLNSPEEDLINVENNTDTFEGLSQEELDILMKQDDDIDLDDIETDVINDVYVYDENEGIPTEETLNNINKEYEENNEPEEYENTDEEKLVISDTSEENKKIKKPKKDVDKQGIIILLSIIFLSVLIVITIIFFVVAIKRANNIAIQKEIEKDTLVSKYTPEDKNTVYFDMAQEIDNETIILEKVYINQLDTTFYFKNKIEPMKYNITLIDSDKNLYPMDLNFTKDAENEENSILRFDTIIGNNKDLKLTFESISTGEKAEFNLNFNANLEEEKIIYINSKAKNNFSGYNIDINYAQFGDKSSRVDYTIEPTGDINHKIYQGGVNETDYVKLKENDTYINPLGNKPISVNIDNKVIGRMDFANIKNKKGSIVLEFDNIYKKYDLNKKVSLNDLKDGNISYNFDKYKLFIEGMPKFDNKYVLVLHTKDTTISTENRPNDFNNVETSLDVEISAISSSGMEVIIAPTEVKSARYGTDIIFELDNKQMSILNTVSPNNMYINIKSALLKEDKLSVPLNLNRGMQRETISHQIMEEQILEAFKSRVQNRNSINAIKGFSSDVLDNDSLKQYYMSLPNKKINSTIDIISKNLGDEYLEAIVQESIQIKDGDNVKVVYTLHKIKANYNENKWTIYSDEIVK
ncbi:hypothetical protein [uncultured Tyzzerella sp.]|uniref:hypothetical protein n=1 Tax=uncultured Tyzzerella sp. TaxID=2321398 RepID=UPI002943A1EC|nr:hypothetical protein [uncultured Tyzzerella sp.]